MDEVALLSAAMLLSASSLAAAAITWLLGGAAGPEAEPVDVER